MYFYNHIYSIVARINGNEERSDFRCRNGRMYKDNMLAVCGTNKTLLKEMQLIEDDLLSRETDFVNIALFRTNLQS